MQPKFTEQELNILKALSAVINKKRRELDKSQRLMAFEYGIQKSMISRFESCSNEPRLFSLWKIANIFGLKLSELISLLEAEMGENIKLIDD